MDGATIVKVERLRMQDNRLVLVATLDISYLEALRLDFSEVAVAQPDGQTFSARGTLAFTKPVDAPAAIWLDLAEDTKIAVGDRINALPLASDYSSGIADSGGG